MNRITRKLSFDSGHRLVNHEGKCKHVHGHTYTAEITCCADALDDVGRVVDFSVIKNKVGGWLDDHWDHGLILNEIDPLLSIISGKEVGKLYTLPCNPTAENMAGFLFRKSQELLADYNIQVVSVKLWETANCFAVYEG